MLDGKVAGRVDKLQTKEAQKEAKYDAKQKAKGYVWKVVAWIHPEAGGDDYKMAWYCGGKTAPTDETIKGWIKKKRSRVETDFKVTAL